MSLTSTFDVLVLGGGPAGAACALELCREGHSVIVIERQGYERARIGETLPPAIRKPLTRLGVWERFLCEGHLPSHAIVSVWGGPSPYENDFIFNPYGNGWHVERNRFDAMLARAAQERGAQLYKGARLVRCAQDEHEEWNAEVASGHERHTFRARFLVDATGRSSSLARTLGATRKLSDRLVGIASFLSSVSPEAPLHPFTLVEAARDGWWYSAPLPGSRLVVAYMTDADLYTREAKGSASDYWQERLLRTEQTRARTNHYEPPSRQHIFNAATSRLMCPAGRNWLATGDAAMAFDPLSSQGIYRALSNAIDAARSIKDHLKGHASSLQEYATRLDALFENYLRERKTYYGAERRWPNSVFWQRRQ